MKGKHHSIYFDAKDHELLTVVNRFIERDSRVPQEEDHNVFQSALHPHGIKELAMSQEIRVAYSVINLLDTLEAGQVQDRINALRALHDEVLYSASSSFRYNTGRVLIQIMKGLIRAHGKLDEQLRLAHDFRAAATGKRRIIRKMLRRYYLLEMPESWNQVAFDNHVHDANTKGRKSPTHLIMDAWIKGLRKLDVVYYNFVEPSAVSELLQAADIMDIKVRIGVEFQAQFRNRLVQFVWQPRGFNDWRDMLDFFQEKPTLHLMRMGREASLYHHQYVMRLLEQYNTRLRFALGREYGLNLSEIPENEILAFVGIGQTSRTHLAELIYRRMRSAFAAHDEELRAQYLHAGEEERSDIALRYKRINALTPDLIDAEWLNKIKNPNVPVPSAPSERDKLPEIMRMLPATLIDWLTSIRSPCHITLTLASLTVEDVLELLYECNGMISHLELYNLKYHEDGKMADIEAISELQTAINEGSAVALKRLIRNLIKESDCGGASSTDERCQLFREILRNIPRLQGFYAVRPLATRIGSDSTSRSSKVHGMGFAFMETLPPRARKVVQARGSQRRIIPLAQDLYSQVTYYPKRVPPLGLALTRRLRRLPGFSHLGMFRKDAWVVDEKTARYAEKNGNITTLGGFQRDRRFNFSLNGKEARKQRRPGLFYLNTSFANACKVFIGFALTMITFLYTQTWWVLAWFGPFVWFAITGFRNVIQATLGGGGLRRTPLLTWNDYLSGTRLCDSLLYTGISVPLLEYGVRVLLLEKGMDINSVSHPLLLYTIMSMVNGVYIAAHNLYRGLPPEAVVGNLFRSVLSIPVSILYNYIAIKIFAATAWPQEYLIESAAVLSKLASDTVAAIIEGFADKVEYIRARHLDYKDKLSQLLACYARLEVLMPEDDVLELLRRPKDFMRTVGSEAKDLEKVIIVNALDLMYFWMYQPRARSTLAAQLENMTGEERAILAHSQLVLTRVQEVSQMLVDGLVGMKFARALAFYLARYEEYLRDMARLTGVDILQQEAA
ncbi:hypothetical protein LJC59_07230 [Desulfovibrio sp. OttesenSCG-928-A18]|nr:hypothetical protein [Desulfovibrio sp. OttesenSCG-928-A18]